MVSRLVFVNIRRSIIRSSLLCLIVIGLLVPSLFRVGWSNAVFVATLWRLFPTGKQEAQVDYRFEEWGSRLLVGDDVKWLRARGVYRLMSGDAKSAVADLSAVIDADPLNYRTLLTLMQAYNEIDGWEELESRYPDLKYIHVTANSHQPLRMALLLTQTGDQQLEQGETQRATELYRLALAFEPHISMPHLGLGQIAEEEQQWQMASVEYTTAMSRNQWEIAFPKAQSAVVNWLQTLPTQDKGVLVTNSRIQLASLFWHEGRYVNAIREYRGVLSAKADRLISDKVLSLAALRLGEGAARENNLELAIDFYQQALKYDLNNALAKVRLFATTDAQQLRHMHSITKETLAELKPEYPVNQVCSDGRVLEGYTLSEPLPLLGGLTEALFYWIVPNGTSHPSDGEWYQVGPEAWIQIIQFDNLAPNPTFAIGTNTPAGWERNIYMETGERRWLETVKRDGQPTIAVVLDNLDSQTLSSSVVTQPFPVVPDTVYRLGAWVAEESSAVGLVGVIWYQKDNDRYYATSPYWLQPDKDLGGCLHCPQNQVRSQHKEDDLNNHRLGWSFVSGSLTSLSNVEAAALVLGNIEMPERTYFDDVVFFTPCH